MARVAASCKCAMASCKAENHDVCSACSHSFCDVHLPFIRHRCGDAPQPAAAIASPTLEARAASAGTPVRRLVPFATVAPASSKLARPRKNQLQLVDEEEEEEDEGEDEGEAAGEHQQKKARPAHKKQLGPKSKTAFDRVRECKGDSFEAVNSTTLMCRACGKEIDLKGDRCKEHCAGKMHQQALQRWSAAKQKQQLIAKSLEKFASTVPVEARVRRFEVMSAFLEEGLPLHSLRNSSRVRSLLESGSWALGSREDLAALIPTIRDHELRAIRSELLQTSAKSGSKAAEALSTRGMPPPGDVPTVRLRPFSVFFDGTTSVAEVFCIVIRFVTDDGYIQQRVAALRLYAKSLSAENLCSALYMTIVEEGIQARVQDVLAFMSDRASVNVCALGMLSGTFHSSIAIGCLSHTISNAAKTLDNEVTYHTFSFVSRVVNIFGRSLKAREMFLARTAIAAKRANLTRWFAQWEVIVQIGQLWGDMEPFLEALEAEDVATENVKGALELLRGGHRDMIRLQIAALMDIGKPLCEACYLLEGDGFLAIHVYDRITALEALTTAAPLQTPNANAVVTDIVGRSTLPMVAPPGAPSRQTLSATLRANAQAVARPALDYLTSRLNSTAANGLLRVKRHFEACRLLHPCRICHIPVATVAQLLEVFSTGVYSLADPFAPKTVPIGALMGELAAYVAAAAGVDEQGIDAMWRWWRQHRSTLPNWSRLAYAVALFQPSSACVERIFSMLEAQYSDTQTATLEDAREASIQLRYNNLQREELAKMRAGE
jgi:hypothetical protein